MKAQTNSFIYRSLSLLIVGLSAFVFLERSPLREWDESRYGVNAVEMNETRDFINYFYDGQLDLWNAKPPLQVWMIYASSQLFGFNKWTLRLPSALAGCLICLLIYGMALQVGGERLAFLSILITCTHRGLFGEHVARTGDMDALFVLGIAVALYCLLRIRAGKKGWLGIGLGYAIAFWAKGLAILLMLPGFFLSLVKERGLGLFREKKMWLALSLLVVSMAVWFTLSHQYGLKDPSSQYESHSAIGVMIYYDIWLRFSGGHESFQSEFQPFSLFTTLSSRFGAYFSLLLLIGLILIYRRYARVTPSPLSPPPRFFNSTVGRDDLLTHLWFINIPFLVILFFAKSKLSSYIAPLSLSFPFLLVGYSEKLREQMGEVFRKYFSILASLCFLIALGEQVAYYHRYSQVNSTERWVRQLEASPGVQRLHFNRGVGQAELLYLKWLNFRSDQIIVDPTVAEQPDGYFNCDQEICWIKI